MTGFWEKKSATKPSHSSDENPIIPPPKPSHPTSENPLISANQNAPIPSVKTASGSHPSCVNTHDEKYMSAPMRKSGSRKSGNNNAALLLLYEELLGPYGAKVRPSDQVVLAEFGDVDPEIIRAGVIRTAAALQTQELNNQRPSRVNSLRYCKNEIIEMEALGLPEAKQWADTTLADIRRKATPEYKNRMTRGTVNPIQRRRGG